MEPAYLKFAQLKVKFLPSRDGPTIRLIILLFTICINHCIKYMLHLIVGPTAGGVKFWDIPWKGRIFTQVAPIFNR